MRLIGAADGQGEACGHAAHHASALLQERRCAGERWRAFKLAANLHHAGAGKAEALGLFRGQVLRRQFRQEAGKIGHAPPAMDFSVSWVIQFWQAWTRPEVDVARKPKI